MFFVPEGDRFYYLGMIYAHEGAANEALDAFRQFLIATPSSQYQDRARSHIVALSKLPLLSQRELDNAVAVVVFVLVRAYEKVRGVPVKTS